MAGLRALWEALCIPEKATIFQDFHWNLLAFTMFAGREEPHVVCARASYGVAIVPAAICRRDSSLRMLGEELFDYRNVLHHGDAEVLKCALASLAPLHRSLDVVALRDRDRLPALDKLDLGAFSAAPAVHSTESSPEAFAARHGRLARNLRRLQRLGFELNCYDGTHSALLRSIYQRKAEQDPGSLFRDSIRVEFVVNAALFHPKRFEIFTLESGSRLAAAVVTLRDGTCRRFYTGWFDPNLEKFSPGMTLIFEATRRSLAAGLDCDYMTGEQAYKMRLATCSVPLFRLRATPAQLAALAETPMQEVRLPAA
jgi:CelD/BcsL family acetyltransferase involved in cellulose biosynthesis